jgi:hypothetical protein
VCDPGQCLIKGAVAFSQPVEQLVGKRLFLPLCAGLSNLIARSEEYAVQAAGAVIPVSFDDFRNGQADGGDAGRDVGFVAEGTDRDVRTDRQVGQLLGGGEAGREVVMGEEMFNRMTNMSRVETRLASIEGLLSQYLPAGQRIIMDSGELVGVVNRGLGGLYG